MRDPPASGLGTPCAPMSGAPLHPDIGDPQPQYQGPPCAPLLGTHMRPNVWDPPAPQYWGPPGLVLGTPSPNNGDGVTLSWSTGCVPLPRCWGPPHPCHQAPGLWHWSWGHQCPMSLPGLSPSPGATSVPPRAGTKLWGHQCHSWGHKCPSQDCHQARGPSMSLSRLVLVPPPVLVGWRHLCLCHPPSMPLQTPCPPCSPPHPLVP